MAITRRITLRTKRAERAIHRTVPGRRDDDNTDIWPWFFEARRAETSGRAGEMLHRRHIRMAINRRVRVGKTFPDRLVRW